ncbi:piggyBac transposable element-derived protein 1-like [Vespula maculifrons]|uniref:PiggyBac transposable element-derived protein 1-like n=1 Tax=Vespula maculifrons TaxID=7453 RepID=A0ABD2BPL8_VESMC
MNSEIRFLNETSRDYLEPTFKISIHKEEQCRFSKKKNINRILSSDSDSDVDKCSSCDSDFVTNAIEQTLQKLIIKKDIKDDNAEKTTIKCIKWTELYGHQKSFSFTATSSLFINNELIDLFAKKINRHRKQELSKPTLTILARMINFMDGFCKNNNNNPIEKISSLTKY